MNDIPEEALRTIEEGFGTRFVRYAAGEPDAEEPFASVFPQSAEEVELLARLGARHGIPLVARGAGTALYPGKAPRALAVRFDAMRGIRLPERAEDWAEVEPGVTWMSLGERLRERGMGPTVYPTSAPRSTVGGWVAENGVGVGSYEYGWLLQNVLWVEAVLAGGERNVIGGEALRHFVGSRGSMGFFVRGASSPARGPAASGSRGSSRRAPWDRPRRRAARSCKARALPPRSWSSSASWRGWRSKGRYPGGARWRSWLSTRLRGARDSWTCPPPRTSS